MYNLNEEKIINSLVEKLIENENKGCDLEQKNLVSREEYEKIVNEVVQLIKKNIGDNLEDLREKLYKSSNIEESLRNLIYTKQMVPGLVVTYGTNKFREEIVIGNSQEISLKNDQFYDDKIKMDEYSIFDLASVTKLFTAVSVLKLVENGLISINGKITDYDSRFTNLSDVTIGELLTFNKPLRTPGRVDGVQTQEEAENILFNIEVDHNSTGTRPYTDMGAMVLKYVVENVSGMSYDQFVKNNILEPLNMEGTYNVIPENKLNSLVSTNFDGKYYKDGNFSITKNPKGAVYDPKARVMGQLKGNLSGHAGLFSTAEDISKLAKSLMNGEILSNEMVEAMAKNRTGKKVDDNYIQYLGMLCYSKNPILENSEVMHLLSGRAFASAGWTGTQVTIDPENSVYFTLLANRSHNRMTLIDKAQVDKIKVDSNGKKTIILPNGQEMIDATRFAWDRDSVIVHPLIELALKYKILEDIFEMVYGKTESEIHTVVRKVYC